MKKLRRLHKTRRWFITETQFVIPGLVEDQVWEFFDRAIEDNWSRMRSGGGSYDSSTGILSVWSMKGPLLRPPSLPATPVAVTEQESE